MILFGLLVGIYANALFFLGLVGLLSEGLVKLTSLFFLAVILVRYFSHILSVLQRIQHIIANRHFPSSLFLILLLLLSAVNLVAAFGPELSFDALWYHLTLPKMYLSTHSIRFIPGGLLYYSAMPQLAEMVYMGALSFGSEIYAKLIHFLFGVLTVLLIYKTARLFVSQKLSLFASLVFYANLVIAWESTTAYVDLVRVFFETGSIYLFLLFLNKKKKTILCLSAVFIGLATSVKILAFGSLFVLLCAMLYTKLHARSFPQLQWRDFLLVSIASLFIPLPWLLFSFTHTGNPLYPFFTPLYPTSLPIFSISNLMDSVAIFFVSPDPLSPIYIICLPLVLLVFKKLSSSERILFLLGGVALFVWFLTPKSGGGRFIIAYLPLFSAIVAVILGKLELTKQVYLYRSIVFATVFIMGISIVYRGIANSKYIPVIVGIQSKEQFLRNNLNFAFGDFYDTDGFFSKNIKRDDVVLLIGFHNLYYVDFQFIDQSWVRRGDKFNYVAVQHASLPERFSTMEKIYENKLTGVSVYNGRGLWEY
ncbi:MAG: glycosyltransferase family 39 protein [Candidatus Levybacteria bacterium]|nr:glycosyltransferase family 39 protein [Candidatus Levybacteria bacterium]